MMWLCLNVHAPKTHVFKRYFLNKVAIFDYAPFLFNHIYIYIYIYTYVHLMYVTSASLKWYVYTIHIHILIYRHMEYISWYQICIHHHVYSIMIHYCQCTSWYVMGPALRTMDYSSPLVVNEIQVGGWWLICGLTYFVNTANWDRWYVTQTHTHTLSLSLNTYVHTYIIYIYIFIQMYMYIYIIVRYV